MEKAMLSRWSSYLRKLVNNKHVNIGWEVGGRSGIRDKEKLASRKTAN